MKVYATCLVRPFWFMLDGLERIKEETKYNVMDFRKRAEHLKYFEKSTNILEIKRILILKATDIANIMITACIDLMLADSKIKIKRSRRRLPDIPEISWFHQKVNTKRGVNLIYIFDDATSDILKEIQDRTVIVEDDGRSYFIKFSFTDGTGLTKGNLELGLKEKETFISWFELASHSQMGMTNNFSDLLANLSNSQQKNIKEQCNLILTKLVNLENTYIDSLSGIDETKKVFLREIMNTISSKGTTNFCYLSEKKSLDQWYKTIKDDFKRRGFLPIAAILDENDKIFPMKIASWKDNWESIMV